MTRYEFKVIPAPRRGEKARGVKTSEERFALALTGVLNDMGRDGWDYVRADALPLDERAGFTGGTKTTFQNMLVFRRIMEADAALPTLTSTPDFVATPRVGPAEVPAGQAPAVGPATDMAAE